MSVFDEFFLGFFNTDTSMCTGFFKFGDVESGATMTLKVFFKFQAFINLIFIIKDKNHACCWKIQISSWRAFLFL